MVPKGWDIRPLFEISKITSGGTPSREKPEYWENGMIPWVRTTEVQNCILNLEDVQEYISELGLKNSSAKIVPAGTVLLAMIGQGKTRGQVALLTFEATTNQNCAAIIFNDDQEPAFYFNFLLSQYEKIRGMSNSAGQSNLSGALVKLITVPVPPLSEQKKIAKILSTWDKAISITEQILANSQQQKKALMQQLLTGKKRLLDGNGVRFSGEWSLSTLSDLGAAYSGLTGKKKDDFGKGKLYIPYTNIFRNSRIDLDALEKVDVSSGEKQAQARYGDIFFTISSETPEEVGMSAVLLDHVEELYLNSFCFGFRLNSFEVLLPEYARYLFRSEQVRQAISVMGQGATRYNLSKRQLMMLELNFPPIAEQQKIVAALSAADQEIFVLQQKLEALKKEKKSLMQQLLTGQRRVKIN